MPGAAQVPVSPETRAFKTICAAAIFFFFCSVFTVRLFILFVRRVHSPLKIPILSVAAFSSEIIGVGRYLTDHLGYSGSLIPVEFRCGCWASACSPSSRGTKGLKALPPDQLSCGTFFHFSDKCGREGSARAGPVRCVRVFS